MQIKLTKLMGVLLLAVLVAVAVSPGLARAEQPYDFDISSGHFYSQGSVDDAPDGELGFTISDDEGIAFWTYFNWAGGVRVLGYPVSQRFIWGDSVYQLTQKALLRWDPERTWVSQVDVSDLGGSTAGWTSVGDWARQTGFFGLAMFQPASRSDYQAVYQAPRLTPSSRGAEGRTGTGQTVEGLATYYAHAFHGSTMANGEPFNMYDPTTTACNIFPLGSWLKVTSHNNGRSIIVRVTDTGGFRYPLIVDLSYAAFIQIANESEGVTPVTIELLQ